MEIRTSKTLNALAEVRDQSSLDDIADATYVFDDDDPNRPLEVFKYGVREGIKLGAKLKRGDLVYLVSTPASGDGDPYFLFVGTEESIAARLQRLPDLAYEVDNSYIPTQDEFNIENEGV